MLTNGCGVYVLRAIVANILSVVLISIGDINCILQIKKTAGASTITEAPEYRSGGFM